jgi:hypothetical protein
MRKCHKCEKELDISKFSIDRHNNDGYKKTCRDCIKEYQKSYWEKKGHGGMYALTKANRIKWSVKYGVSVSSIAHHGLHVARQVYDKYNRKCDMCGSTERLAIHHIDGKGRHYQEKGLKPNNHIDNLQLLCIRCHGHIHGKNNKRKTI